MSTDPPMSSAPSTLIIALLALVDAYEEWAEYAEDDVKVASDEATARYHTGRAEAMWEAAQSLKTLLTDEAGLDTFL